MGTGEDYMLYLADMMIEELRTENAKLRELVWDMYGNYRVGWNEEIEDELYDRMRELGVELEDENARLRSCLSDDAENARMIMAENAKLRELMKHALINLSAWMGDGHPEWMVEAARELGIEVDA